MYPRCRTVAALVRNLERPSERLDDSAEKRGGNRKSRHGMGCFHEKGKRTRPRNPGHVDHLAEQGRHSISQERKIIRLERRDPSKPIDRRGKQQQHHEWLTEPIQHAMQIVPSLSERKSRSKQRPFTKQGHLNRSKAPAGPLRDVFRYSLGRQPDAEFLVQPPALVTLRQHRIGKVDILGDRLARKSADLSQPVAANDKGSPYAERASPCILGRLEYIEEKPLVVDPTLRGQQMVLDRIRIVIDRGCRKDGSWRIGKHPEGVFKKRRGGGEIRSQPKNARGVGLFCGNREPVVRVPCLATPFVAPADMARPRRCTVFAEPPSS